MKNKLKLFREHKKITQAELARRAGLSRTFILQLEMGRSQKPSAESLYKISQALGVKMEDFFDNLCVETPVGNPVELLGWAIQQLNKVKNDLIGCGEISDESIREIIFSKAVEKYTASPQVGEKFDIEKYNYANTLLNKQGQFIYDEIVKLLKNKDGKIII